MARISTPATALQMHRTLASDEEDEVSLTQVCCGEVDQGEENVGSRCIWAMEEVKDQVAGGNGNEGRIGESESEERVGGGETNLCTGEREHED